MPSGGTGSSSPLPTKRTVEEIQHDINGKVDVFVTGISSEAAVAAVLLVARRPETCEKTIVVVSPNTGSGICPPASTEARMFRRIRENIRAMLERDPAARHPLEVLLCHPGMHALWAHRVNHWLWNRRLQLLARLLAHIVRRRIGVEIHPGARIGR